MTSTALYAHCVVFVNNSVSFKFQAPIDVGSWLRPVDLSQLKEQAVLKYFKDIDDSDLDDIYMYQVL